MSLPMKGVLLGKLVVAQSARNLYGLRATSHTRLRAGTIKLRALSLVEKVELVQVRFTL